MCSCLLTIVGLSSQPALLKGDVIFTSVVGNCCGGYSVEGTSFSSESLAESFVPDGNYILTDAQVMVFQDFGLGGDPYFDVSLYSNAGRAPGSLIATLGTDLSAPAEGGMVIASGPMPALVSGTPYWLVLTPFDSGTQVGWEMSNSPALAHVGISTGEQPANWLTVSTEGIQFQVDGTPVIDPTHQIAAPPVPEPASFVLAATALALIALFWVRKAKSVDVFGQQKDT